MVAATAMKRTEAAVLAAVMLNEQAAATFVEEFGYIAPEFFDDARHAAIAGAILRESHQGAPVDYETVARDLHEHGQLQTAGGALYICGLSKSLPNSSHALEYFRELREGKEKRDIARVCEDAVKAALEAVREQLRILDSLIDDLCPPDAMQGHQPITDPIIPSVPAEEVARLILDGVREGKQ